MSPTVPPIPPPLEPPPIAAIAFGIVFVYLEFSPTCQLQRRNFCAILSELPPSALPPLFTAPYDGKWVQTMMRRHGKPFHGHGEVLFVVKGRIVLKVLHPLPKDDLRKIVSDFLRHSNGE